MIHSKTSIASDLSFLKRKEKQVHSFQKRKALSRRFGYILLILISAVLGIFLQVFLRRIDPLSAIIDSSIWVVVLYTLCSFLIYNLVTLRLTYFLLRIASKYNKDHTITTRWQLYFLGVYFLVLYGFLFCLSLWM